MDVSQTSVVEDLKLCPICLGDVGEVFCIVGIDVFGIRFASLVSKMVPFRCCQSELGFPDTFLWQKALQIIPLINVGASNVLDLAGTDDCLSRLMAAFGKGSNVRDCSKVVSVTVEFGTQLATYHTCGRCRYRDSESLRILLDRERMYPCSD